MKTFSSHRSTRAGQLALVVGLLGLLAAPRAAQAQYSFTTQAFYDSSQLSKADWAALGKDFTAQSVRGAMALVFADRAPITDPKAIESYIKTKGLLGAAFPGLTADPVGAWAMAKQLAVTNKPKRGVGKPVLAVNSGWTDFGAGFGHFYELGGLRPTIEAGKPYKYDHISKKVADLAAQRPGAKGGPGKKPSPFVVLSHSAGGYYGANVAWLLKDKGDAFASSLRVYSFGIATRLPKGVKAKQLVGTTDTLGQVNSSTAAFSQPGTKVVDKLSHGNSEHFGFADSFGDKRWTLQPLSKLFTTDKTTRSLFRLGSKGSLIKTLRDAASKSDAAAAEARKLADGHKVGVGVKQAMFLRLDHEATMLGLRADRERALADLLKARAGGNAKGVKSAHAKLKALRNKRLNAHARLKLSVGKVRRDMMQDTTHFATMMLGETAASMMPMRTMQKAMQASIMGMKMTTQWTSMMLQNPFVNPFAAFARPSSSASSTPKKPRTRHLDRVRVRGPSKRR